MVLCMSVRNDRYSIIITHSFVHMLFSFLYFVHKCLFGGLEMKDNRGTCETYWQFFFCPVRYEIGWVSSCSQSRSNPVG